MFLKEIVKKSPIYRLVSARRARRAEAFLKFANLYPESRAAIVGDYAFSIRRDYRDVMQIVNLEECIRYVAAHDIPGSFVEAGVFTGGASAYALRCMKRAGLSRMYWGFDSFEGMPNPTKEDGNHGKEWIGRGDSGKLEGSPVNRSDYDATRNYLLFTGYEPSKINLVKGWFQDTLPKARKEIGDIAILRIDGDLFESTKVVLEQLYDNVVGRGIVIIDDYGTFQGCRKAVDDFLRARKLHPFMHYVENGIRFFVKS